MLFKRYSRNLLEREKLQNQVSDLSLRVQQQNETISMLQRRIALEAKNFRHQLQNEINKHKDTRHDLDLAINNADKLTTIIEVSVSKQNWQNVTVSMYLTEKKIFLSLQNKPICFMLSKLYST